MVNYAFKDLYYEDSIDKQLKIEVDNGAVITNEDIFSESMKLTESLCSDTNLSFGSCEASKFEIKIANQFYSMKGMWLTVSETLTDNIPTPPYEANAKLGEMVLGTAYLGYDGENWDPNHSDAPFVFGRYKVESDRPTADRSFREIVAYDALYDIINADATEVAEWYDTLLPELDSTVTLKEFRDSFFELFDIEQEKTVLPNDDMVIEKTISTASLTGKEVINAICEINGCFGHIGRDNKFHYIFLPEISDNKDYALAADDDSFLASPVFADSATSVLGYAELGKMELGNSEIPETVGMEILGVPFSDSAVEGTEIGKENWQTIDYEDYTTKAIDSLQIRDSTEDAGLTYNLGVNGNNYIIDGNFLLYGKGTDELQGIAKNIYDKISVVTYRPTDATLRGNPCFEVGDIIILDSKYQEICTYILSRTLTGIQALKDNYVSTGNETYENSYNSMSYEVEQLKGITNIFERQVESNTLKIENLDGQVSKIEQTLDSISFTVTGGLGGTASIVMKVGDEAITADVDLSDVREAFANENSSVQISAGTIAFVGNTLIIDSENFKLTATGDATFSGTLSAVSGTFTSIYTNSHSSYDSTANGVWAGTDGLSVGRYFRVSNTGELTATSGTFSGSLSSPSGNIGGFTIGTSALYKGTSSISSSTAGVYVGTNGIRIYQDSDHNITINSAGQLTAVGGSTHSSGGSTYYPKVVLYGGDIQLGTNGYDDAESSPLGYIDMATDGISFYYKDDSSWFDISNLNKRANINGGTLWVNGSSVTGSDEELKSDIIPLTSTKQDYEKVVETLNPVSFEYKTGGKKHIGFTYQNAVEALEAGGIDPDDYAMVSTMKDKDTGEEIGGIEYNDIVALLVYEIQKLKSQIESLKA